tara:strand:+ start:61 stop:549 length:489 start_codon:yes stop_codon:yes gene_type:complete
MKKIFITFFILSLAIACGNDDINIYEPLLTKEKVEFPFEDIENGKFQVIFRNYEDESIAYSVVMISNGTVIENSQEMDFCEGVTALRNNKQVSEWLPINYNYSAKPESQIENQNDHPNLISYSFPKGTYIIMLQDITGCSKENYSVFDVLTNDGLQLSDSMN